MISSKHIQRRKMRVAQVVLSPTSCSKARSTETCSSQVLITFKRWHKLSGQPTQLPLVGKFFFMSSLKLSLPLSFILLPDTYEQPAPRTGCCQVILRPSVPLVAHCSPSTLPARLLPSQAIPSLCPDQVSHYPRGRGRKVGLWGQKSGSVTSVCQRLVDCIHTA